MKEYKVCIYCICKNESKFVDRFMDAVEELKDHVYILDTGSTDNTVELFKRRGAHIQKKEYEHFTFDVARNDALNLVPDEYDICISLDIDDVIKKGFVDAIKKIWDETTTQIESMYYYTVDENDNPLVKIKSGRIHSRKDFRWIYPIHEVLEYTGGHSNIKFADDIIVVHKPDIQKSRSFYMDLLEERVRNVPTDSRNIYLLAREYLRWERWFDGLKMCHKYLDNKNSYYSADGLNIKCYLARIYRSLKMYEESNLWADIAIADKINSRNPYLEKLITCFEMERYDEAIKAGLDALCIDEYNTAVIDRMECWDGTIYDYLSISYYYIQDYNNAIKFVDMDIKLNPNDNRLKKNRELFISKNVDI